MASTLFDSTFLNILSVCLLGCINIYLFSLVWHSYEINQPFEITFLLPKADDKRTHGYTPNCIRELKAIVNEDPLIL
jgi:hypothetical protein